MKKSKQLLIAILSGCEQDHEIYKDILGDPATADDVMKTATLSKADLFSMTRSGTTLFEHKKVWDNLDVLVELIRRGGEDVSAQDFTKTIVDNKSALDWAENCNALDRLFSPYIWKGRLAEMEDLWFQTARYERNKYDYVDLRRKIAQAGGQTLREDRLKSMGIETSDLSDAISNGSLGAIADKFKANGDYLRREDFFIADGNGDIVLEKNRTWPQFGNLHKQLAENGEEFRKQDFLFKRGDGATPLAVATKSDNLDKIFTAEIWKGRPQEMLELFDDVPENEHHQVDIAKVLTDVMEDTFASEIRPAALTDAKDLTEVFNKASSGSYKLNPLGMKSVWDNMGKIRRNIEASGNAIALADLRNETGYHDNGLRTAARYGQFDQVVKIAEASGEKLTLSDLTEKGKDGSSVIDMLSDQKEVGLVMKPEMWVGRPQELLELWDNVAEDARTGIDFQALHSEVNRLTLREKFTRKPGIEP